MASYKRFDSIHDMKREAMRLTTFKNKWNCKVPEPADIAYAGLYSARHLENNEPLDHTICAFCNGIIGYWETNDVPITEHKRHFPDCPYMRGSPVGNIPVRYEAIIERVLKYIDSEQQQTPNTRPRPESVDTTGLGTINTLEYSSLMMEAGVSEREMPKYPTFKTLDSRHKSFYPVYLSNPSVVRVWPSSARMGNALADAGFFYCGVTDHVRCFQCGGGLRNLEETDDFWALHATFYPKCQYLYLVKGSQYIENVQQPLDDLPSSEALPEDYDLDIDLTHLLSLDIPAALAKVTTMDVIKKAIKMQLTKHRIMFTSLDDAIDQVTDIDIEPTIEEMANAEPEEEEQTTENELEEAENETNVEEVGNEEDPIEEMGNEEGPIFDNLLNRQIEYLQQIIIEEIDKEDKEKEELANKAENDKKELQLNECKICMDKYVSVIFLPCKHMIACTLCASALTECPVCRKRIGYAFSPIKI